MTVARVLGLATLTLALAAPTAARADFDPRYFDDAEDVRGGDGGYREFAVGVGYTRINFDGDSPLIDDRDGVHLDPFVSFAPVERLPGLRLGAAFGISFAVDDVRGAFVSGEDGGSLFVEGDDALLMLFEPELRVAWRIALAEDEAYFIEAGVGGGGVVGWLSAGDDSDVRDPDDAEVDEVDAAFMGRAFVRFGMHIPSGIVGLEASYLHGGRIEFTEGIGGDVTEAYVGIFGALTF